MANVLIVDDLETDRLFEARIIEDAGHTPFFAGDGDGRPTDSQRKFEQSLKRNCLSFLAG